MLPGDPGLAARFGLLALGIAASIVASHILYLVLERPSLRLAARISANARAAAGQP
jgi:peptidoglycan/LPS O-acetylase OafA/YrhL